MKDIELKVEEMEVLSHTRWSFEIRLNNGEGAGLYATSDTLGYINLTGWSIGLVTLCGPRHLCVCVSEDRGDGEGMGSPALSDTLRYINLTGWVIGLVVLCGPMWGLTIVIRYT